MIIGLKATVNHDHEHNWYLPDVIRQIHLTYAKCADENEYLHPVGYREAVGGANRRVR
jgi:hypothetical protein